MSSRILMVDDDPDDQFIFKQAIDQIFNGQANLHFANDANAALKVLSDIQPHYIFIDINLPRINGFEFLLMLEKLENSQACTKYILSTTVNDIVRRQAKAHGAVDCIEKGNSIKELTQKLDLVLNNSSSIK